VALDGYGRRIWIVLQVQTKLGVLASTHTPRSKAQGPRTPTK
jgi:hypothetical protein